MPGDFHFQAHFKTQRMASVDFSGPGGSLSNPPVLPHVSRKTERSLCGRGRLLALSQWSGRWYQRARKRNDEVSRLAHSSTVPSQNGITVLEAPSARTPERSSDTASEPALPARRATMLFCRMSTCLILPWLPSTRRGMAYRCHLRRASVWGLSSKCQTVRPQSVPLGPGSLGPS